MHVYNYDAALLTLVVVPCLLLRALGWSWLVLVSGAEIFEQRLRELSKEEAERSALAAAAAGGGVGGVGGGGGGGHGMDYIDSWAEQNEQEQTPPPPPPPPG